MAVPPDQLQLPSQPQQSWQPLQQPGEPWLQQPLQPTMTGARAALRPPQQNQQAVN
ncbi:hypothetical protein FRB94_005933, partial [Tulasnella sp. JGI-2019a]